MKEKSEKELKTKKAKEQKKSNKEKKEKKPNKFIQTIKKKWLIDGTKTTILVLLILAVFFGICYGMQKLDLTPIDLTEEKLFTLTEEFLTPNSVIFSEVSFTMPSFKSPVLSHGIFPP